jgi:exopolysaccharide biosynthesis polyprenyl glycosylphosphotransferase
MSTSRRVILLNVLKLVDLALMVGSFLLTTLLILRESNAMTFSDFLSMRIKIGNFVLFFVLLVLWHIVFSAFGLYDSRRMSGRTADAIDAFKAAMVATSLLTVASLAFRIRMISPSFLLVFWSISTAVAVVQRVLLRSVLERIRLKGRNLRNMLIVGTNSRALEFASRIEASSELGYRIIGFVDQEWTALKNFNGFRRLINFSEHQLRFRFKRGHSVVSDFDHLSSFLRDNVVDEIIIALPFASLHPQAARIAMQCEEQGITTRVLPNIFDLKVARARADELEDTSLITNYTGVAESWPVLVKRGLDIVVSAILLVLLAPLLLLVAILIKVTSPGPVLFTQNRVGYNKRRFKVYKFRTMTPGAEHKIKELEHLNEVSGPVFKIKNDPRITPVGKLLRKTSIDELPQLFNVLKGDMSLVGPRPLPERDYEGFNQDWQRRRFSVRPGITCLWQINGRSSIAFDKWMQLDLQYIDTWSLWLDLEILVRTIPAVLKGSGAS